MNYKFLIFLSLSILYGCKHPDADTLSNSSNRESVDKNLSVLPSEVEVEPYTDSTTYQPPAPSAETHIEEENSIPMERKDGVTYVWIEVNGIPLKFIFDTGASSIFISPAEALVLYRQGMLDESDIIGKENYEDATGGISTGTVIILREVKIGNKLLKNVQASVSENFDSPLLLGQSALEQFGSIEIDNTNNQIVLK